MPRVPERPPAAPGEGGHARPSRGRPAGSAHRRSVRGVAQAQAAGGAAVHADHCRVRPPHTRAGGGVPPLRWANGLCGLRVLLGRGPLWGKSRVGAEIDSYLHHSSLTDWAADRSRHNLLRSQRLTPLKLTEPDMKTDPAGVAAQFEEALVSRGVR